jgi:hypothetical protein
LPRLAELTKQAGKERTTEWLRTCDRLPIEEWPPAPAYKGPMVPAAERDERQARIDAALALCDAARVGTSAAPRDCTEACGDGGCNCSGLFRALSWSLDPDAVRAALVGDQPKAEEPEPRCCIGPFADGTHAPGCLDACQDCGGDEAGPHRCQCSDAKPVCTCTPSRCDYDGYPLTGPACLPCGQRPVGKPCLAIDDDTSEENQ